MAEEEIALLRHLDGEDVARVIDGDASPGFGGAFEVALGEKPRGGDMGALAVVGARQQRFGGAEGAVGVAVKGPVHRRREHRREEGVGP